MTNFEEGWLDRQLKRAKREIGIWPVYKQESLSPNGREFTKEERIEKLRTRIQLLREEIERDELELTELLKG